MTRTNLDRVTLAALPFVLALLVDLVLFAVLKDRLPGRIASHFGVDGAADGHVGRTAYVLATTPVLIVLGALWGLAAVRGKFHGRAHRRFLGAGWALAGFLGYLSAAVLTVNADAPGGGPADRLPPGHLAAAVAVAVLAGALGLLAARAVPAPAAPSAYGDRAGRGRIVLAEGEVAGWARSTGAWWLPLAAAALLAVGVVLGLRLSWFAGAPVLLLALPVLCFCRPYVTVDRRGLTVSGLLPWPRVRVPLERIAAADSRRVDALAEYGGWGYRVRPGRTGFIVRSGEAIVARQTGGRDFAVTVEDSATAAALLNTLVDRHRAGR
ncbi:hypothetical protein EES43_20120 [Streptomyces sp. ADI96-02]|uniref:DUF1648 domain-containing protein n=1 Tax=Streptomyces sp. ADI96-02 TaxID=1522760 RepID=UPI000F554484|nr:DUF1648 domain-containing protein [Streptomyces sp. ADI96-02]RPK58225.1 hypothetical protein EES43_20120 [Streptomyces sp. ADI96-02]